jgi:rSAM/selenodomain-associated transferase 2
MTPHPSVSIIVPVWNEAAHLPICLSSIGAYGPQVQVIVVDAESNDGSPMIAQAAGAMVLSSPVRQRAAQVNTGAGRADGDVLLFLHADTQLPTDWLPALRNTLASRTDVLGGAYRRRFDRDSIVLRITCQLADWRGRLCGIFLGDQAMFVRRDAFIALGGFKPFSPCEDLDFSIRLSRLGRCCLLPATVHTSARRFEARGPVRQTIRDFITASRFILSGFRTRR